MEFKDTRSGTLNFTYILASNWKKVISILGIDPKLQRNIPRFGYQINYKYEGQSSHSIVRYYVFVKFMLQKLNDILLRSKRMLTKCNNCNYFSPNNEANKKNANSWSDFWTGQI